MGVRGLRRERFDLKCWKIGTGGIVPGGKRAAFASVGSSARGIASADIFQINQSAATVWARELGAACVTSVVGCR